MKNRALAAVIVLNTLTASMSLAQTTPTPNNSARISLGDISDNRSTGQWAGLRVDFKLSGDSIFDAYGITKPNFTAAKDDTGRSLLKADKQDSLLWDFQPRQQKSANENISNDLLSPARKATSVTLQGTISVYSPTLDPSAVVTVPNLASIYGHPMESKPLGISLTILDKNAKAQADSAKKATANPMNSAFGAMFGGGGNSDNDLEFRVKDPHNMIVRIEILDSAGKALETNGRSKTTFNGEDVYNNSYKQPIPKDASLRIYYATAKSMQSIPFNFENVPLP